MSEQAAPRRWEPQKKRTPSRPPSINDIGAVDDSRFAGFRDQILTGTEPAKTAPQAERPTAPPPSDAGAQNGSVAPVTSPPGIEAVCRSAADGVIPDQSSTIDITVPVRLVDTPTPESVVMVVASHWGDARDEMLLCGRYLARAREMFRGRFSTEIIPHLPFERATADKLAKVAILVDAGVLPVERLPPNYSTAFLLLTLDKPDLAKAEERNLIRPNVSRKEVEAFRAELRAARTQAAVLRQELREKKLRLLSRRDALDEEIRKLEEQMAELGDDGLLIEGNVASEDQLSEQAGAAAI